MIKYSTSQLLLSMAFIAIVLSAVHVWYWSFSEIHILRKLEVEVALQNLLQGLPLYFPFTFLGYVIGRKAFTGKMLLLFALAECMAIEISSVAIHCNIHI